MRYSLNELKNSFEAGTTSNWVVSFHAGGGNHPSPDSFNMIAGKYFPALDIDYASVEVIEKTLLIGPGVEIVFPITAMEPREIKMTYYEEHKKVVRGLMHSWVSNTDLISLKRTKSLSKLKEFSMKLSIEYFDKELNPLYTDTFYIVPKGAYDVHGDNTFQIDTNMLAFIIIGKE